MKLKIFSVRDSAMDAYARPFFTPTVALAARSFRDEVNRPDSEMSKHPADYELFELGEYDEDSGKFVNAESPRSIVRGSDAKEVQGEK